MIDEMNVIGFIVNNAVWFREAARKYLYAEFEAESSFGPIPKHVGRNVLFQTYEHEIELVFG